MKKCPKWYGKRRIFKFGNSRPIFSKLWNTNIFKTTHISHSLSGIDPVGYDIETPQVFIWESPG